MTYPQITTHEPDTYPMEEEVHEEPELTQEASPISETETQVDKDKKVKIKTIIKQKTSTERTNEVNVMFSK